VSDGDPYVYPGTVVLRNRFDILDEDALEAAERRLSAERIRQGVPTGAFDLAHLRAVHRHLFQDIYDWAGELRTVEIAKEGHQFQFRRYIETGMADVHRRLVATRFLVGLGLPEFAAGAGEIIGDINYVHPFREGNGRAQLQYLRQLADRAGHPMDLTALDREAWMAASRDAHRGDYAGFATEIERVARR
jgi:cell filamentation protein, protein adenylyltransferase